MENKRTIFFPLLLILGENNAAGNINDTLYPQQRWKRSNKVVMGLTIWNSHTGLISLVSRHSKPIFFKQYSMLQSSRSAMSQGFVRDSFLNIVSPTAKCNEGPFLFQPARLGGKQGVGRADWICSFYHSTILATLLREYW